MTSFLMSPSNHKTITMYQNKSYSINKWITIDNVIKVEKIQHALILITLISVFLIIHPIGIGLSKLMCVTLDFLSIYLYASICMIFYQFICKDKVLNIKCNGKNKGKIIISEGTIICLAFVSLLYFIVLLLLNLLFLYFLLLYLLFFLLLF